MKTASQLEFCRGSMLTGGLGSVVLHVAALLIVSLSLRGCQKVGSGDPGGEPFREIGLFVSDGIDGGSAESGIAPGAGSDAITVSSIDQTSENANQNDLATSAANTQERLPSEAPDVTDLLNATEADSSGQGEATSELPSLIGPGSPIGGTSRPAQAGGSRLIQPSEAGGAAKLGGIGGPGETTFMEVAAVGKTFVYVIDTSSSMYGGRLKTAQSQLKKSIRLLQPNQQFGVIFYNEYRTRLMLPRQGDRSMHFATELNKLSAAQQIDRVVSDSGTDHKLALLEAMTLKADVIYFLTDGETELSAADLREIAKHTGQTTIHVIKFGDGKLESLETSWLERLARQANGEFREFTVDP